MNAINSSSLSYRPEINGLRAIAVLSVIFYHAKIILFGREWLVGGFLGVDIFFVISGYLITRIIIFELQLKGSFSFTNFYERRARRILPMLFMVILTSMPVAWYLLLPYDFEELAKSILASTFFGSNFFFYSTMTEYGAESSLLIPFLHTWSLSVEEQFYLLFPILAIFAFKFFRRHFLVVLIAISFVSLLFAEMMLTRNPGLNFYLPISRAWELTVGSILALRELDNKTIHIGTFKKMLPVVGLSLIIFSILTFNTKTPHPSLYTLIPVMGVALIIAYASKDELVGRFLGCKQIVWIGLVSYSAYLWHYPIMAFSRIILEEIDLITQITWIFLSFILAAISYVLIEEPLRNREKITPKYFTLLLSTLLMMIVLSSFAIIKTDGFKERWPSQIIRENFDDRYANQATYDRCHLLRGTNSISKIKFCDLGSPSDKKVYLIGDSHMGSIAFKLLDELQKKNKSLVMMTRSGSLFGRQGKEALDIARIKALRETRDSTIIFGGFIDRENEDFFKKNIEHYENIISDLISRNNKIVIIYPFPTTNINRIGLGHVYSKYGELIEKKHELKDFLNQSSQAYAFYDSLDAINLYRIYPSDFLCDDTYCYGIKEQKILISDEDHPSAISAEWIVKKLDSLGLLN